MLGNFIRYPLGIHVQSQLATIVQKFLFQSIECFAVDAVYRCRVRKEHCWRDNVLRKTSDRFLTSEQPLTDG